MKRITSTQWWVTALGLALLVALSTSIIYAQTGGSITVNACTDQNADGDCDDPEDGPAPSDVEACLNDETNCQPVPATFSDLDAGSYTVFLQFSGASQNYYPTTPATTIDLAQDEQVEVSLGAVYPVHPKGVAVHEQLNKVYVAFQGPVVITDVVTTAATETVTTKPYPFVAVIDGETDKVLQTIPGGEDGIGSEPWGVAVSGDNVYVGSFGEGRVSVIDANSDTVIANIEPARDDFQPTAPAVNPLTGWVHFPDYRGGRVVIIDGTDIVAEPLIANQFGYSPFEAAVASTLESFTYVTMRDAIFQNEMDPNPFQIRSFSGDGSAGFEGKEIILSGSSAPRPSGSPHALGLWQDEGDEPRLFVTYADDTRLSSTPPDFINPNKLLVYSFPTIDPKDLLLRNQNIEVGDYAEVGLVYNADAGHMLGTYAGFAYDDSEGDAAACSSDEHGGTYAVNFDGNLITEGADVPGEAWKLPQLVVGNPPLVSDALQWANPFEIAINPNNGKVYVTDRCWIPEGAELGGGAVLIFDDTTTGGGTPTPTPTITPSPTVTTTPTVTPSLQITLAFEGPASVEPSETFSVDSIAQNVPDPGLYGVQFEINYDPNLVSVISDSLPVNSDFAFVVIKDVDNTTGKLTLVASRQGNVPGLTGDVPLLTFDVTAADTSGSATFTYGNEKIGDPEAIAFDVITETYTVLIGAGTTPTLTPTVTTTPTVETPTPTTTPTGTITPTVTTTPTTETPTPTGTITPTVTATATTETPTPTMTPTATGTPATETPTPTPTSMSTPTGTVTPPTETPTATITPTGTSTGTIVVIVPGQVVLSKNVNDDWSGATVEVDDTGQDATTDVEGNFDLVDVPVGTHSSITADAPGYVSAVCESPTISSPSANLAAVSLTSGDIDGDDSVDITDATAVGASFGETDPATAVDINDDSVVDILDIIAVSISYGLTGPTEWTCQ